MIKNSDLLYAFMGISILSFGLMALDKQKARRGAWRIPERNLWIASLLGGALGAYLGMRCFHHKNQKKVFRYGLPILTLLQWGYLYYAFFMK